jgi:hypothetical protein
MRLTAGLLPGCPTELGSIDPHAMQDDSELAGEGHFGVLHAAPLCDPHRPTTKVAPASVMHQDVRGLIEGSVHHFIRRSGRYVRRSRPVRSCECCAGPARPHRRGIESTSACRSSLRYLVKLRLLHTCHGKKRFTVDSLREVGIHLQLHFNRATACEMKGFVRCGLLLRPSPEHRRDRGRWGRMFDVCPGHPLPRA